MRRRDDVDQDRRRARQAKNSRVRRIVTYPAPREHHRSGQQRHRQNPCCARARSGRLPDGRRLAKLTKFHHARPIPASSDCITQRMASRTRRSAIKREGGWRRMPTRSLRLHVSEMDGALDKVGHVFGCQDRERMMGEAGPGGDVIPHVARDLKLSIRAVRQNSDHQILERDDPDAELHQFVVRQVGNVGERAVRSGCDRATFVLPACQNAPVKRGRVQDRIGIRHRDFLVSAA